MTRLEPPFTTYEDYIRERGLEPHARQFRHRYRFVLFGFLLPTGMGSIFILHQWWNTRLGMPVQRELIVTGIVFIAVGFLFLLPPLFALRETSGPRASVTITPAAPRLGEECTLKWEIRKPEALRTLKIDLEGFEMTTIETGSEWIFQQRYGHRIDALQNCEKFLSQSLVDAPAPLKPHGSVKFTIPSDAMHSFMSAHSCVDWCVRVASERARRIDANDEYPLTVRPHQ